MSRVKEESCDEDEKRPNWGVVDVLGKDASIYDDLLALAKLSPLPLYPSQV